MLRRRPGSVSRFFSYANLLFPSLPQSNRCEPQSDGGQGENDRKSSNDALVVSLNEFAQPLKQDGRGLAERGAVFLIILVGGLFFVSCFYDAGPRPC